MIDELLQERKLMPVWDEKKCDWPTRRREIVELLSREEYGFMPREHTDLTWEVETQRFIFCAGRVELNKVTLTVHFGEDKFSFPIYTSIPKRGDKLPFFVHINFRDAVPDRYMPVEEICDRGYALVSFCYNDVTPDAPYEKLQSDPLWDILYKGSPRKPDQAGKIRIWAWAASRALDYALTLDRLDPNRVAVTGHSRLGKTALVAGMTDERFKMVVSNDSGCSGAAITRGKQGETVKRITEVFPHWFCENYYKYADREYEMPFDQHYLLAASAPRLVYVASSQEDIWSDPVSEFLACCAADEVYKKLGMSGFVRGDELPDANPPQCLHEGDIGYHERKDMHYYSREDWNYCLNYADKHLK